MDESCLIKNIAYIRKTKYDLLEMFKPYYDRVNYKIREIVGHSVCIPNLHIDKKLVANNWMKIAHNFYCLGFLDAFHYKNIAFPYVTEDTNLFSHRIFIKTEIDYFPEESPTKAIFYSCNLRIALLRETEIYKSLTNAYIGCYETFLERIMEVLQNIYIDGFEEGLINEKSKN